MMPFDKSLDAIAGTDIESLVGGRVKESQHLEYKFETYGTGRDKHLEFLKDVTALANAYGGYLIIGIKDDGTGVPEGIVPVPNAPGEVDRLVKMAWSSIEPRISGLVMRNVATGKGEVILIHVPRSGNAPHMALLGANCFWRRHDTNNLPMSTAEISDTFQLAWSRYERGSAHAKAKENEAVVFTYERPTLVVGFFPLLSYPRPIDPSEPWARELLTSPPDQPAGPKRRDAGVRPVEERYGEVVRPNLMGLARWAPERELVGPRLDLERNGFLGMRVTRITLEFLPQKEELDPLALAGYIVGFLRIGRVLCERIGFEGEALCYLVLGHVAGLGLRDRLYKDVYWYGHNPPEEGPGLPCITTGLQPFSTGEPKDMAAKRLLDIVYNAWGYERSPMFADGAYNPGWVG